MTPVTQARAVFLRHIMELHANVEAGKETEDYRNLWIQMHDDYGTLNLHEFEEKLENMKKAGMGV